MIDGAAAEKVVGEWRLVGAGVERDSLGGRLQVALERDAGARLGRVVVEAHVAAERLPQVNVSEINQSLQFSLFCRTWVSAYPKLCGRTRVWPMQSSSIPCKELESLRN